MMQTNARMLCAACVAERPDNHDAAWQSDWAETIYSGNALCLKHFRAIRIKEQNKRLREAAGAGVSV